MKNKEEAEKALKLLDNIKINESNIKIYIIE